MKNLQNFGVQELNAKEIRETEGGLLFLGACAVILAVAYICWYLCSLFSGS